MKEPKWKIGDKAIIEIEGGVIGSLVIWGIPPEPEHETDKYFGVVVVDDFCDEFGEIMWQNGESFNAHYSEIKKPEEYMPEHINTKFCWCEPELNFEDPETDSQVWVHRELQ